VNVKHVDAEDGVVHARATDRTDRLARLARLHAVGTAADALVAVALAGSLFFNTSLDLARPRLALTLALTLAPIAVLTPLIGPAVTRLGAGSRLLGTIAAARVVCACMLGAHASSVFLYPESLAFLVLGRAYAVAKRSLVPTLVPSDNLIAANARLSRVGSVAGVVGGGIGSALLPLGHQSGLLFVAAGLHAVTVGSAARLRVPAIAPVTTAPAARRGPKIPSAARPSLLAMCALRLTAGFVVVMTALTLERAGEPTATLALLALAVAVGSFAGTFVSAPLRARVAHEQTAIGVVAMLAAGAGLAAATAPDMTVVLLAIFLVSVAASVGRHACDAVVQRGTTHTGRNRAFAWCEAALQLAWVAGALIATIALVDLRWGFIVVTLVCLLGVVVSTRARGFGVPGPAMTNWRGSTTGAPWRPEDSSAGAVRAIRGCRPGSTTPATAGRC